MKKITLTLCTLFIGLFIQAQVPYTPFPKGDISWQSWGCEYYPHTVYHFELSIDTGLVHIDDKTYNKVFFDNISHPTYIGGIREEDKKIYMYPKSGIDTSFYGGNREFREFLIYDFGLEIGDTLFYSVLVNAYVSHWGNLGVFFYDSETYADFQWFIIAKDKGTITLENGEKRNTLIVDKYSRFDDIGSYKGTQEWVEGLGLIGDHGFLTPIYIGFYDELFYTPLYLECICQNNTKLLSTDAPCLVCGEVQVKENFQSKIALYPNPTTGELTIDNGELTIKNIEIFDLYGKKLSSLIPHSSPLISINISDFPAGIYFLRVNEQTVKVIKN